VPAPFVIRIMVAAALSLCNFSCDEIMNYSLYRASYSNEYFDIMCAEQVDSLWSHSPGKNMRNLMVGKQCRKFPRFMSRAEKILMRGNT